MVLFARIVQRNGRHPIHYRGDDRQSAVNVRLEQQKPSHALERANSSTAFSDYPRESHAKRFPDVHGKPITLE